jgi:hypothetical protein
MSPGFLHETYLAVAEELNALSSGGHFGMTSVVMALINLIFEFTPSIKPFGALSPIAAAMPS